MGGTRGEIVIGQRLGMLMNEWDVNGGLDPVAATASAGKDAVAPGPMIGAIAGMGLYNGLTIETTLDPIIQPFLHDHQIDGTPVLPGVMGIEAFAEAASCMLPGWHVAAIEEVNFLAPFKFYRNEPRTLTIKAVFHSAGDVVVADCQLQGHRSLPNQAEAQVTTHFTARVRLAKNPQESQISRAPITQADSVIEAADIYRIYFHGPAYQVLARAWRDGEQIVGQFSKNLPNNHFPTEKSTLMAPRLIELCFQIVGLGEMSARSQMGLPHHIEQVRAWNPGDLVEAELYGVVTPDPNKECFNAEVVDSAGNRYIQLSGYRTVALPNRVDIEPLKALQAVAV
jgi:hypothetical protein